VVDTRVLKAQVDLRRIVEQDLGPAPMRGGQALLWRCPFHHERQGYSLAVWADGFRCFGKCQVSGDALDWLQLYRHLSFQESLQALGEAPRAAPGLAANRPTPRRSRHLSSGRLLPGRWWRGPKKRCGPFVENRRWNT